VGDDRSGPSTAPVAMHKHVGAVFLAGYQASGRSSRYRENYLKMHGAHAPLDRLAYCALVHVNKDKAKARKNSELLSGT